MTPPKRYSLTTIAEELGVSKSAVSFVMNGTARSRRISPELERRIRDFCHKVNYRPNIHAQRMNGKPVNNIGVLLDRSCVPHKISPFRDFNVACVVGGIADAAAEAGYRFSCQFYSQGMSDDAIYSWFENKEISGLIYYGLQIPARWVEFFHKQKFCAVGISIDPAGGVPCVNVNNYDAEFQLVEQLIGRGHRKFLYIGGYEESFPGKERFRGFADALKRHEIAFSEKNYLPGKFNRELAAQLVKERWMRNDLDVDAIVCANDDMAIGVIHSLQEAGIGVPERIAVVGADNTDAGSVVTPPLTTFDYLPFEQGREAFTLLKALICNECEPHNAVLNTTISWRRSG